MLWHCRGPTRWNGGWTGEADWWVVVVVGGGGVPPFLFQRSENVWPWEIGNWRGGWFHSYTHEQKTSESCWFRPRFYFLRAQLLWGYHMECLWHHRFWPARDNSWNSFENIFLEVPQPQAFFPFIGAAWRKMGCAIFSLCQVWLFNSNREKVGVVAQDMTQTGKKKSLPWSRQLGLPVGWAQWALPEAYEVELLLHGHSCLSWGARERCFFSLSTCQFTWGDFLLVTKVR